MTLIYCGIDEAGYGPMLGPLCVGFSAFRLARWVPESGAPDLWQLLEGAVCRRGRDARGRIAVADSKKLKLANQSKTRHPLMYLERGVLAFGGLVWAESESRSVSEETGKNSPQDSGVSGKLETDSALLAALGVRLEPHVWYGGEPVPLPMGGSAAQLAIARNTLALACEAAEIEPIALACIAVGESALNEALRAGYSKAHLTARCFGLYLRRVIERWGGDGEEIRILCDRHGGRTKYRPMIEAAVQGLEREVETMEESGRCSRYAIHYRGDRVKPCSACGQEEPDTSARIHVQFRPEAEEAHLPVALASMTAKLVRELAMARFNRYWSSRVSGLKPTAGYVQDARRWLRDVECVLGEEEREQMVRMA